MCFGAFLQQPWQGRLQGRQVVLMSSVADLFQAEGTWIAKKEVAWDVCSRVPLSHKPVLECTNGETCNRPDTPRPAQCNQHYPEGIPTPLLIQRVAFLRRVGGTGPHSSKPKNFSLSRKAAFLQWYGGFSGSTFPRPSTAKCYWLSSAHFIRKWLHNKVQFYIIDSTWCV